MNFSPRRIALGVSILLTSAAHPPARALVHTDSATPSTFAGSVGVGTVTPQASLDVRGQIRSVSTTGAAFVNNTAAIDWNKGNAQVLTAPCTSTTFTNVLDGGSYTLAVTDTSTTTCSFSQGSLTFVYSPANANRSAASSVYSFQRLGSVVYVAWSSGFQ